MFSLHQRFIFITLNIDNYNSDCSSVKFDILNESFISTRIALLYRVIETVTTSSTWNVASTIENNGRIYVVSPYITGVSCYYRAWISPVNNLWYITVVNAQDGILFANKEVVIRYSVLILNA